MFVMFSQDQQALQFLQDSLKPCVNWFPLAFAKGYLGWEQEFFVIKAEHYKVRKKTAILTIWTWLDLKMSWIVLELRWSGWPGMTGWRRMTMTVALRMLWSWGIVNSQARPDLVNTGRTLFGKLPTRHQQGEHSQAHDRWILYVSRCFKCLAAIQRWFKVFFPDGSGELPEHAATRT